jgi:hypothetical protein
MSGTWHFALSLVQGTQEVSTLVHTQAPDAAKLAGQCVAVAALTTACQQGMKTVLLASPTSHTHLHEVSHSTWQHQRLLVGLVPG